jgi:glycosyltransferase involved in cell wall biosynthesis
MDRLAADRLIAGAPVAPAPSRLERARPLLLVVIYGNPDFYPPTVNAVRMFADHFRVKILARNMGERFVRWPDGVTLGRLGELTPVPAREVAPAYRKLAEFRAFIQAVRAEIASSAPAAVYAYDSHAFVAAMPRRPRRNWPPVILHMHELPEPDRLKPWSLGRRVAATAMRRAGGAAEIVFPEAARAEHWRAAAGVKRRPSIVPNCASREFFAPPADWGTRIARRFFSRRAILAGTLGATNGQAEAIRAMALIGGSGRLEIVGDGGAGITAELARLARELGMDGRVQIRGWLPHGEVSARLDDASLGLVLYKPATLNLEYSASATNKLFEYAAAGLPVVAPDLGNYRRLLSGESWVEFADPGDPRSIADAIARVLADGTRYAAMSRAGGG